MPCMCTRKPSYSCILCKYSVIVCIDSYIIVATAQHSECNETDKIRLVGGLTPHDGRVEVCVGGLWVLVCDEKWGLNHAEVVCRQLGYNGSE